MLRAGGNALAHAGRLAMAARAAGRHRGSNPALALMLSQRGRLLSTGGQGGAGNGGPREWDGDAPPSANKSWVPVEGASLQKVTRQALVHELTQVQMSMANTVVPWFLSQMPSAYFRQVPESVRVQHLRAICALQDTGSNTNIILKSESPDGRREMTFIRSGNYTGQLREMIAQLPRDFGPLCRVKVFTSMDHSLVLNVFTAGSEADDALKPSASDRESILQYAAELQQGKYAGQPRHQAPPTNLEADQLNAYIDLCTRFHVSTSNPRRFLRLKTLYDKIAGTENCAVDVEEYDPNPATNERRYWVSLAQTNVLPRVGLDKCLKLFKLHKLDVLRCHMDRVNDPGNGSVCLLRMLVQIHDSSSAPWPAEGPEWTQLKRELHRAKWLDDATIELATTKCPALGLDRAEIIVALGHMLHGVLAKQNLWAFSKASIFTKLSDHRNVQHAAKIADLFMAKFDPAQPLATEEVGRRATEMRAAIRQCVEDTTTVVLLDKMLEVVESTYRTNLYMPDRYSLALRIDPKIMMAPGENRVLPYGVFFVHGRRFNGFHVRFRDIARGGLRIVSPPMPEQIAIESARQFDEAYGLAYAQQLKNKDIPEGGSKAVVLVDTVNVQAKSRDFAKRKAVKGFVDGLLDLIIETPETQANIVDYWGKREYLYLGPDEQIIPNDIVWIVRQAQKRQYTNPFTFMSSKPDAGINHKVYGVTSEGIAVFLAVGLKRLGLDPSKDNFTIKLTGGTDGDVAGNMIKILARDYGPRARVVGLADGTAVVEDPAGLDMAELLRLVDGSLALAQFNPATLSATGQFHTVDSEEGIRLRNTMHSRVEADAFIPAGGRPGTIDGTNYRQFLKADQKTPSARLIVEGANIFITPEARKKLFEEAGVLIIKDSSANKCGVICSSFEIISSMLLSEGEFKEHKEEIVAEVLEKLRYYARLEAELLFREFANYPGALPYFSERISNAINLARDAVTQGLEDMTEEQYQELLPLFQAHLPATVVGLAFDRVREKVPAQYIKNAFGSCLASRIVYREGTHFIESQPRERLAELCLRYLEEEREVHKLIQGLETGGLSLQEKAVVHKILDVGGVRSLLFAAP